MESEHEEWLSGVRARIREALSAWLSNAERGQASRLATELANHHPRAFSGQTSALSSLPKIASGRIAAPSIEALIAIDDVLGLGIFSEGGIAPTGKGPYIDRLTTQEGLMVRRGDSWVRFSWGNCSEYQKEDRIRLRGGDGESWCRVVRRAGRWSLEYLGPAEPEEDGEEVAT